jgi:ATP-binding cassette subfamily B protein
MSFSGPYTESLLYTYCYRWAKKLWPSRLLRRHKTETPIDIAPFVARFLVPYQFAVMKALLLLTIAALTVLSFGFAFRLLVDHGFSSNHDSFINVGFIFFLGASALLALNAYFRITTTSWIAERLVTDVRREVFGHLLTLDQTFFETARTGDLISRINTDTSLIQTLFTNSAAVAVRSLLQLIGATLMMFFTSLKLTGIVFLVVPVILSPIWLLGRWVKRLTKQVQEAQGNAEAYAAEHLASVTTLQLFNREQTILGRFISHLDERLSLVKKRIHVRSGLVCIVIFFAFASVSCVLWIGSQDVLSGHMTAGALVSFVFFAVIVAGSLNSLSEVFGELQTVSGACERLVELLIVTPTLTQADAPQTPTFEKEISLDQVTFSYPTRPTLPSLTDFSLTLKKGEKVALVGPSGAGKSTVFQLLLRLFDPQSGTLLVDGTPYTACDLPSLRHLFAVVPQETLIFNTTIEENIRFGERTLHPSSSFEDVCKKAHVDEFVSTLPQGYQTVVGERGVRLSGGQKQRLALARAFLREAEVLLLDEATNALDSESEAHIQEALTHLLKDKTAMIIAHRLSTIENADRIIVLDQGRVVEQGTYTELLAKNGLFARLVHKQQFTS